MKIARFSVTHESCDIDLFVITLSEEHQILIGQKPEKTSMPLFEYTEKYIVADDIDLIKERLELAIKNIGKIASGTDQVENKRKLAIIVGSNKAFYF